MSLYSKKAMKQYREAAVDEIFKHLATTIRGESMFDRISLLAVAINEINDDYSEKGVLRHLKILFKRGVDIRPVDPEIMKLAKKIILDLRKRAWDIEYRLADSAGKDAYYKCGITRKSLERNGLFPDPWVYIFFTYFRDI